MMKHAYALLGLAVVCACGSEDEEEGQATGGAAMASGGSNASAGQQAGPGGTAGTGARAGEGGSGGGSELPKVVSLSAGDAATCAVYRSGDAYCWGMMAFEAAEWMRPTKLEVVSDVEWVVLGEWSYCAKRTTGALVCWGSNGFGMLGVPDTPNIETPIEVSLPNITSAALGASHACYVSNAEVYCAGANHSGQLLEAEDVTSSSTLVKVPVLGEEEGAKLVVASKRTTCALTTADQVACWGSNGGGLLGTGTADDQHGTTATRVGPIGSRITNATDLTMRNAACALLKTGKVSCWGSNGSGMLGTGQDDSNQFGPTEVANLSRAEAVAVGYAHVCAVTADRTVVCWGDNLYGQLGTGDTDDRLTVTDVPDFGEVQQVVAGGRHTCALTIDGDVYCWGQNTLGQVGVGDAQGVYVSPQKLDMP